MPERSIEHTQRTIHIEGDEEHLKRIAKSVPGMSLYEIREAFESKAGED